MAFKQFSYDMEIIAKLKDAPNVDDGLTADQLKDKFDEAGKVIKDYINDELLPAAVYKPEAPGMMKWTGNELAAATPGVDYQAPIGKGDITTEMLAADVVAPKAAKLETARSITVQDSSGEHSAEAVSFDGSEDITLKMPEAVQLTTLIAGSGLVGTTLPENPVEGQVFFLIEEEPVTEEGTENGDADA